MFVSALVFRNMPPYSYILQAACVGCMCYDALYLLAYRCSARLVPRYLTLPLSDRRHWNTLFPSVAHAFTCVVLSVCILAHYRKEASVANAFTWTSPGSYTTLSFSWAYFTCDVLTVINKNSAPAPEQRRQWTLMMLHHAVCLVGLSGALGTGLGHVHVLWLMLTEATTPFVNARWLLDKAGKKDSTLYVWNGALMAAVWVAARILPFPPYFRMLRFAEKATQQQLLPHALLRLPFFWLPLLLASLNSYWFTLIVRGLVKHTTLRRRRHQNHSSHPRHDYAA